MHENNQTSLLYRAPAPFGEKSFFDDFQRLDEILKFIDELEADNKGLVSTKSIGKSFEARDLKIMKISNKNDTEIKPIVYIDAGTHAREWITISTAMYIANRLVQDYNYDTSVKKLVNAFDWYILPVANPDGYEYTHTKDRMWRKTRSATKSIWGCKGVDPNRNWGFHWNGKLTRFKYKMPLTSDRWHSQCFPKKQIKKIVFLCGTEVGASGSPCSEIYAGSKAFSEVETKTMANFLTQNKDKIKIFLTLHSYSQLWLTPWGYTSQLPSDYDNLVSFNLFYH
ncbi:carboxypeptidase B-like protein [Dinothrombium tinctorium]|uniref:Carboxypeptidase B-like protein n=1 Tax=Dinothrombium tinctorium TaxID=1965070 RepID=A0A443RIY4_9ACAR|nr:carboxypeptidase B-like protein [Dinothrombium tinctorium]